MIQTSMSVKYEPFSEPLHDSAKQLFLDRLDPAIVCPRSDRSCLHTCSIVYSLGFRIRFQDFSSYS